ncbi:MAG: hypothetical protein K5838_08695 [Elusimicrobiales bacterium]|nr:hypothetical protein [Elusimicrobiales bacterium]
MNGIDEYGFEGKSTLGMLKEFKSSAASIMDTNEKPGYFTSIGGFFSESFKSLFYVLKEKENITFAILQWIAIIAGYYLWVMAIGWIPEELFEAASESDSATPADLILLIWSFICVGLTTMPIGLLTACMAASQLLNLEGRESTILDCLKCVMPRLRPIWIFSWFDGWLTVKRILSRLPKKNDRESLAEKLIKEAAYQGWKFASLGFIPAIVSGRTVMQACQDSLSLAMHRFIPLAKLRIGYSIICWITGIACYVLTFTNMDKLCAFFGIDRAAFGVHSFYLLAGIPLLIALLILVVFVRPLYIISAARIYANYTDTNDIRRNLPDSTSSLNADWFILMLLIALIGSLIYIKEPAQKIFNDPANIIMYKRNPSKVKGSTYKRKIKELRNISKGKNEQQAEKQNTEKNTENAEKQPKRDSWYYHTGSENSWQEGAGGQ